MRRTWLVLWYVESALAAALAAALAYVHQDTITFDAEVFCQRSVIALGHEVP